MGKAYVNLRLCVIAKQFLHVGRISKRYRHARASTKASNPFPYPTHRNPTPHQIFHLPRSATDSDVKARCTFSCFADYDLVRLYHPDKVEGGGVLSPEISRARFQAITAAYDALREKTAPDNEDVGETSNFRSKHNSSAATIKNLRRRQQELYDSGPIDNGRKDKLFIFGVVLAVAILVTQTSTTRRKALAETMRRNRTHSNVHSEIKEDNEQLSKDVSRLSSERP